jgi:hypothetical protein
VKTQDAQRITSQFDSNESPVVTAAASRLALASRPVPSSLAASALAASALAASGPRAARVVAAAQAALLQEERCAGAATARSAEESVAAEQAHSDWAPAEDSAVPSAGGSLPAVCSAAWAERRCSLDAWLSYWPPAERGHAWPEGYKALLPLWPVRLRDR